MGREISTYLLQTAHHIQNTREHVQYMRTTRKERESDHKEFYRKKFLKDVSRVFDRMRSIFGYGHPSYDIESLIAGLLTDRARHHASVDFITGILDMSYLDGSLVNPLAVIRKEENPNKRNERLSHFLLRMLEAAVVTEYMKRNYAEKEDSWSVSWRMLEELPVYATVVEGNLPNRYEDILNQLGGGFHTLNFSLSAHNDVLLQSFHQVNGIEADRISRHVGGLLPQASETECSSYITQTICAVENALEKPIISGVKEQDSVPVELTSIDLSFHGTVREGQLAQKGKVALSLGPHEIGYCLENKTVDEIAGDVKALIDYVSHNKRREFDVRGVCNDRTLVASLHRLCKTERAQAHLSSYFAAPYRITVDPHLLRGDSTTVPEVSVDELKQRGFCFPLDELSDDSQKTFMREKDQSMSAERPEIINRVYDATLLEETVVKVREFIEAYDHEGQLTEHAKKIISKATLFGAIWYSVQGPSHPLMSTVMTDIFPQKLTGSAVLASVDPLVNLTHDLYTLIRKDNADPALTEVFKNNFVKLACAIARDIADGKAEIDAPSSGVRLTRAFGSEIAALPVFARKLLQKTVAFLGRLPQYGGGEAFIQGLNRIDMAADQNEVYNELLSLIYEASSAIKLVVNGRETSLQEQLFAVGNVSCTPQTRAATTCVVAKDGMRFRLCEDNQLVVTGNRDCHKAIDEFLEGVSFLNNLF